MQCSTSVCKLVAHISLAVGKGAKNKRQRYGPTSNRSWAIKASFSLPPSLSLSTTLIYLFVERMGRSPSLAHGGPPIRVGNDLQSCAAKWRFGSELGRAGYVRGLHHAVVNEYGTHTNAHVGFRTTKMATLYEPLSKLCSSCSPSQMQRNQTCNRKF